MISAVGGRPVALGPAEDRPGALRACFERGEDADVLVTVGGASMGDADLVKRVLGEMGYRSEFWRVRMRPGSPLGFGWLPRGSRLQPVFSLPGNPTSAFVTFEVFVRPFLLRLAGHREVDRVTVSARSAEAIPTPARLTYFLRVTLDGSGEQLSLRPTGPQGSGLVAGLAYAGGLAVIPEDVAQVEIGASVRVRLIGPR
jgi:molybdopterin molybdotransferase